MYCGYYKALRQVNPAGAVFRSMRIAGKSSMRGLPGSLRSSIDMTATKWSRHNHRHARRLWSAQRGRRRGGEEVTDTISPHTIDEATCAIGWNAGLAPFRSPNTRSSLCK
jgi:hypothetical protein